MRFYVYLYRFKGVPVYVGKGQGRRAWQHSEGQSHSASLAWLVNYCSDRAIPFKPQVVFRTSDELEALAYEKTLIGFYRRLKDGGTLINKSSGTWPRQADVAFSKYYQQIKRRHHKWVRENKLRETLNSFVKKTAGAKQMEYDLYARDWFRHNCSVLNKAYAAAQDGTDDWKSLEEARASNLAQSLEKQRRARLGI